MQPASDPESRRPPSNPVARFFLWCSGCDEALLGTPSERTRQIGLGTLVMIPPVLALFAMTYAISTVTDGWWIPALAGMAWAAIVLSFDRYVVSTFRKSGSIMRDVTSPVFLTRLALATFVGVLVAHPLVLLYFEDSIDGRLDRDRSVRVAGVDAAYAPRITEVDAEIARLHGEIEEKRATRLEAQEVLAREIGGIGSEHTSGRYGRGPAAEAQEELRAMAESDLEQTMAALPERMSELDRRRSALIEEREAEKAAVPDVRDYIARTGTLEKLASESTAYAAVQWFLILFFVFVDTLPLMFKVLTPRGPYDERLEIEELRASEAAHRARAELTPIHAELARTRRGRRSETATRRGLPSLWHEMVQDLEHHRSEVRALLDRERQAIEERPESLERALDEEALEAIAATGAKVTRRTVEEFDQAMLGGPTTRPTERPEPADATA